MKMKMKIIYFRLCTEQYKTVDNKLVPYTVNTVGGQPKSDCCFKFGDRYTEGRCRKPRNKTKILVEQIMKKDSQRGLRDTARDSEGGGGDTGPGPKHVDPYIIGGQVNIELTR
jgi:hypothetical protein